MITVKIEIELSMFFNIEVVSLIVIVTVNSFVLTVRFIPMAEWVERILECVIVVELGTIFYRMPKEMQMPRIQAWI